MLQMLFIYYKVLSSSVANAFKTMRTLSKMKVDTMETERFCRIFDKFFDIFNIRNSEEADRKKKPDLKPFYSSTDERLQVSS